MTTKPPRLPDPCTPEQAAEWLTNWSDETWNGAAVISRMLAVEAQSIAYERGIVLVLIRPGTKLLRLNNGEWMPFETVAAMHLEVETGAALAYVFKGGEHYDATGGVMHLDPVDDSFIGQLASLGHATPRLLVDRDGTRYHVTEPVQASDIRLRRDWVNELLSEFDRLAMGIERGEHPDIASMLDPIQNTDPPPTAKETQAAQATKSAKSVPEAKKDKIRAILAAIKELDPEFSHEAMPGQKADFFALCREYDPQAFQTVAQSTFNDYLKGWCKFGNGAIPTDYYRKISHRIGVKRIKTA